MPSTLRLSDLSAMHPRLLWDDIVAAATAVLAISGNQAPLRFPLEFRDVPAFGTEHTIVSIDTAGVPATNVARLCRTYEPPRLVELAAIAVAGLAVYYGGGHEIVDVAVRGTACDYLVDTSRHSLEIAGRSRRSDSESTWQRKWQRLAERVAGGFYLCVAEFETPSARLAFRE